MLVENFIEKVEVPAVVKRPSKLSITGMLFYVLRWNIYDVQLVIHVKTSAVSVSYRPSIDTKTDSSALLYL